MSWIDDHESDFVDHETADEKPKARFIRCPLHKERMVLDEGTFGHFYICPVFYCDMRVGAHPDGTPKGKPADEETRKARIEAHTWFDRFYNRALHKSDTLTRDEAYAFLAAAMGIKKKDCHIANFNRDECARVVEICKPSRFPYGKQENVAITQPPPTGEGKEG